ncbi:sialyltransferase [Pycnococcus provasolii]
MVAVSVRASFMAFLVVLGLTGIVWHPLTHGDAHLSGLGLGQEALNDRFHDLGGMHMQVPDVEEVDLHHVQNAWDVIPQEQIAAQRQASLAESSEEDDSMHVNVNGPTLRAGAASSSSVVSKSPASPCGAGGHGATDGNRCLCTALFSGVSCDKGPETFVSQEFAVRFQGKNTMPDIDDKPRQLPASFDGPYLLNKQDVERNQAEVMRIYLPGKQPPWRRVGKVDPPLLALIPPTDPANKRFRTCALVGNSGSLIHMGSNLGREVDAAEMVMRFNAAPTKGLEKFVGSKTTFRLVNSRWMDFRESDDEALLFNMRAASTVESYRARIASKPRERFYLFSQEMVNYMGQQAYQLSRSFKPNEAPGFDLGDYTPTSGFTGLLLALQVCSNITVYGMMISEAHGMPYHYQNRCPQPYGERDEAEWLLFKRFAQNGLLQFREPCVVECHESGEMCESCRALHPEVFSKDAMAAGHAIWNRMPMPEYCVSRAKVLAAERLAKAQGKVGERGFTKEQRDALMNKFSSKPQVSAAAKAARAASSRSSHASSSSLGASASSSSRRYHVGRISRRR